MWKLIAWRVAQFPLILAIIYLTTFMFVWVAPGSPFGKTERQLNEVAEKALKEKYHATTWYSFLAYYPANILRHGDFGPSMQYAEWSVNDILASALPISITTRPPDVVTNGPFILKDWQFKRRLLMEKSQTYWDKSNVRSNTIEMVVVDEPVTGYMRYEAGEVDWLAEVPSEIGPELLASARGDFHNFGGFGTTFLNVMVRPAFKDGTRNPLSDIRVRQALAMSLDKQQIVRNITRLGETPATTYIPPDAFAGYHSSPGLPFDVPRAKKLLADAGFPSGGRLPGVWYLYRADSNVSKELGQNYVHQWKDKLNLDIPLESVESKIARQRISEKDYAICASNWIGDYGDVSTFTDKYRSTSVNNDSDWRNADYDQLLDQAAREADAGKRLRLLEKAEAMLNNQVPIIPVFHVTNQYMYRGDVHGINLNPRTIVQLKYVYKEKSSEVAQKRSEVRGQRSGRETNAVAGRAGMVAGRAGMVAGGEGG